MSVAHKMRIRELSKEIYDAHCVRIRSQLERNRLAEVTFDPTKGY